MWTLCLIICIIIIGSIVAVKINGNQVKKSGNLNNNKLNSISDFQSTDKIIGINNNYIFAIDQNRQKIAFVKWPNVKIILFDQIIGVEIIEDNTVLSKKSFLSTVGNAAIGGAIAGSTGAIIGGMASKSKQSKEVSNIKVKIKLRDVSNPSYTICCFDCKTMTIAGKPIKIPSNEDYIYKQCLSDAQHIVDTICAIIETVDSGTQTTKSIDIPAHNGSIADEIMKLSELKDKGILTEDEFLQQKRLLLTNQTNKGSSSQLNNNIFMPQKVIDALESDQQMLAVKLYNDITGCGLKEAKRIIDEYKDNK